MNYFDTPTQTKSLTYTIHQKAKAFSAVLVPKVPLQVFVGGVPFRNLGMNGDKEKVLW